MLRTWSPFGSQHSDGFLVMVIEEAGNIGKGMTAWVMNGSRDLASLNTSDTRKLSLTHSFFITHRQSRCHHYCPSAQQQRCS